MRVQLLYFEGCPNVTATRARLRLALEASNLEPTWEELDLDRASLEEHHGSPTVLVDGRDVCPEPASAAPSNRCCRVYPTSDIRGVPPLENLLHALKA